MPDSHYRGYLLRYKFGKFYVTKNGSMVKGPFATLRQAQLYVDGILK
jgi:hypothetical protein